MPQSHLLIFGASTRAAAFSAMRAGFQPRCADLFADADLQARCPVHRLSPDDYPRRFHELLRLAPPGPWLYSGALENRRGLVRRLAPLRPLWGNNADVLARVRSPAIVRQILEDAGLPCPVVRSVRPPKGDTRCWLVKPCAGAGGLGIGFWERETASRPRRPVYFQQYIEGEASAALFVGNGVQARFLGLTRQLIGESWLHALPFRYCGSIGPLLVEPELRKKLEQVGNALTAACHLRGLFGVDCVLRDGVPWPVEINPRYTASVEVLEYATGLPAIALHQQVFDPDAPTRTWRAGSLSDRRSARSGATVGKAILFARAELIFPAKGPWSPVLTAPRPMDEMPAFADLPHAGQIIKAGHPILTYFARADSTSDCSNALQQIAADLDQRLFSR
ncbi:MAG TPA: ATP-grasp domain-containing protein [Gemmataceae bacterium]